MGGGLAILARNDLCITEKQLRQYNGGKLEVQAVTLHNKFGNVDFLNLYNPNESITSEEYIYYFSQLSRPYCITGDFNAHHGYWDSLSSSNASGNALFRCLEDSPDMCLLTPKNLPTYYHVQTNKSSTIDLCFLSSDCFPGSTLSLGTDMGSDHTPCKIEINIQPSTIVFKSRSRWILDPEKWHNWRSNLPELPPHNEDQLSNIENFHKGLTESSDKTLAKSKEIINPKYSKGWWNEKCAQLVKNRHHAKNVFKKHPTIENKIKWRRAEALAKREIKIAKKQSFQDFCSDINSQTPTKLIWRRVAALSNRSTGRKACTLISNLEVIQDPRVKACIFADQYEKVFNLPPPSWDVTGMLVPIASALTDDEAVDYNGEFSMSELSNCIKTLKNTSPGHDNIHNLMLKNLSEEYYNRMLRIINDSFNNSFIPPQWKLATIIPIHKPNKPSTDAKSYRPISLLPCFPKLMEKLINQRLYYVLERNKAFKNTQFGFRKRLTTVDHIVRLESTIQDALTNKKYCVAVFFDLESAYDCVWHFALVYKLVKLGVKGKLLAWIEEFLRNRKFRVFFEGCSSTVRKASSGVPQGSVLSPTLFNVMMTDLPIKNLIHTAEYADDVSAFSTGSDLQEVLERIQTYIDELQEWSETWGLKLNLTKTKAMVFSKRRINNLSLSLDGDQIEFVKEHKFLGAIFDAPSLTWKTQIQKIKEKRNLNLLI